MKPFVRKALLAVTAAGLVASVVTGRERPSAPVVEPAARIPARVEAHEDLDLTKLERPAEDSVRVDPFARRSFAVARIARPAQKAAALPPLPFQYLGKVTEGGKTEVYVTRGPELISIAPGQTLGEYHIDQVTESSISFTYLPLKTKQTMDLPGLN